MAAQAQARHILYNQAATWTQTDLVPSLSVWPATHALCTWKIGHQRALELSIAEIVSRSHTSACASDPSPAVHHD